VIFISDVPGSSLDRGTVNFRGFSKSSYESTGRDYLLQLHFNSFGDKVASTVDTVSLNELITSQTNKEGTTLKVHTITPFRFRRDSNEDWSASSCL